MKNLVKIRKAKGLKQEQVAEFLQMKRGSYGKYERGERKPDPDTLIKLSELFDVAIDYLVGNIDVPVSPTEYELVETYQDMSVEDMLEQYEFHNSGTELTKDQQREILQQIISADPNDLKKILKMLSIMNDNK